MTPEIMRQSYRDGAYDRSNNERAKEERKLHILRLVELKERRWMISQAL